MDRQGSTSEDLATSMDDLRRFTMARTANIIDHHRRTSASPATALIAALHLTMSMVLHRQTSNMDPANIVNTALLHHYHLVISTSPILLHLTRNVHTKGQDGLGNLTGMLHREIITMAYLNIATSLSLSIRIITNTHPSTTGHNLTGTIIMNPLQQSVHMKTPPSPSNCARVKPKNPFSPSLLRATKQLATYTPTGPSTICTFSISTGSPQERRPTARSTHKTTCC